MWLPQLRDRSLTTVYSGLVKRKKIIQTASVDEIEQLRICITKQIYAGAAVAFEPSLDKLSYLIITRIINIVLKQSLRLETSRIHKIYSRFSSLYQKC